MFTRLWAFLLSQLGPEGDRKDGWGTPLPIALWYAIYGFLGNAVGRCDGANVATTLPNFNPIGVMAADFGSIL